MSHCFGLSRKNGRSHETGKFIFVFILIQPVLLSSLDGGSHKNGGRLYGQTVSVPPSFQDLYSALDSNLSSFESTIASAWRGKGDPVTYSAELISANSNQGKTLLGLGYYRGIVLLELGSLQAMGVQAVTVSIDYPILYPGFYQDTKVYQQFLNFYAQLVSEIRSRNLKLIIKTNEALPKASPDLQSFYSSLTLEQYESGRTEVARAVALYLKPDYLTVIDEPDTEASVTGISAVGTVSGSTALLNAILNRLKESGVKGVQVGAGVGTWLSTYQAFIHSFAATSVDYIDMHVYPINYSYLENVLQIATIAASYGKPVAMSEAWLTKVRNSELSEINSEDIYARNTFSFWAPLDARFLATLLKTAVEQQFLFFSPFWTLWFDAYNDYNSTTGMTSSELITQTAAMAVLRMAAGSYTATGLSYALSVMSTSGTLPEF